MTPLQLKVEDAFTNADSLLVNVNEILDDDAKKDLQGTLREASTIPCRSLNESAVILNRLLSKNELKLDSSLTNFQELTYNFAKLSDSLNNAGLGRTLASLESTVANLNKVLGQNRTGRGAPWENLWKTSNSITISPMHREELDLLLQDFRLNPKRYVNVSVFGKKQKEYELPEDDPAEKSNQQ